MIVLANGCWDLLHIGHVMHLQAASKWGILYVSVTDDAHVNKGPGRPVFPLKQRMDMVRALECVHGVIAVSDVSEALRAIQPDIFVKGKEYEGKIQYEHLAYCREHGIQIRFTDEPVYSSTALLNELRRG
jgi:cytidyltransferase-like protein